MHHANAMLRPGNSRSVWMVGVPADRMLLGNDMKVNHESKLTAAPSVRCCPSDGPDERAY